MDGRSFYPFLIKFSKRRAGSPETYHDHLSQPGSRVQPLSPWGGAFLYSPLYGVPPPRDAEIKRARQLSTIACYSAIIREMTM